MQSASTNRASAYGHRVAGDFSVEWAYSTLASGLTPVGKNSTIVAPVNTFLGMANWFKLGDASGDGGNVDFSLYDFTGELMAAGVSSLAPGGTFDLDLHTPMGPDTVGSIVQSTDGDSAQFTGEVLRVATRSDDGGIATIIPISGVVLQNGDDDGAYIGSSQSLAKYRDTITAAEARRLLTVTQFGATQDEIDRVVEDGLEATVTRLTKVLTVPNVVKNEANDYLTDDDDDVTMEGVQLFWLTHIYKGPNTLRENMALFWHDRFASSCEVLDNGLMMEKCKVHLDLLRDAAFGNYRTLLREMTRDFLMLVWLNGRDNLYLPGRDPDENYAREIMELFSLGEKTIAGEGLRVPLYTPDGIKELARALTGYTTQRLDIPGEDEDQWVVSLVETRHDPGTKTMWEGSEFETVGAWEPIEVPDILLNNRGKEVGRYVASAMFTKFCHDHPNDALRNKLSDILRNNDWEVKPLLRAILNSAACFSVDAKNTHIKDPIEHAVGFLKTTGIPMTVERLNDSLIDMGLELMNPSQGVFGNMSSTRRERHNESVYWLGFYDKFRNFFDEVFANLDNDFPNEDETGSEYDFCNLNPSPDARSDEVVDQLAFITALDATSAERAEYVRFLDTRIENDGEGGYNEVSDLYNAQLAAHCRNRLPGVLQNMFMNPKTLVP